LRELGHEVGLETNWYTPWFSPDVLTLKGKKDEKGKKDVTIDLDGDSTFSEITEQIKNAIQSQNSDPLGLGI